MIGGIGLRLRPTPLPLVAPGHSRAELLNLAEISQDLLLERRVQDICQTALARSLCAQLTCVPRQELRCRLTPE